MKLYKLTDKNQITHVDMKWKIGKTNKIKKCENPKLCTKDVIHAYKNKNLALLLNPIHANIDDPLLFEAKGIPVVEDFEKCGVFSLKINKKLSIPEWYINKEIRHDVQILFSILCAESVLHIYEKEYPENDTPRKAIEAAKEYLKAKNAAAAVHAVHAAARAAHAADYAAAIATCAAAIAVHADYAAYAAAITAHAACATAIADYAAYAAAGAAHAAAGAAEAAKYKIDFCKLADKAVKNIMLAKE
jgi:hypothetical protein